VPTVPAGFELWHNPLCQSFPVHGSVRRHELQKSLISLVFSTSDPAGIPQAKEKV
jgi:hypothetical protein